MTEEKKRGRQPIDKSDPNRVKQPYTRKEGSNRPGRPNAKVDLKELEKICMLNCTDAELAAYFQVSVDTIDRLKKNPEFAEIMQRGKANGKLSLRRSQFRAAMEDRNPTMLIWLGKQYLEQDDKQKIEHTGKDGGAILTKHLSDEELEKRIRELTDKNGTGRITSSS